MSLAHEMSELAPSTDGAQPVLDLASVLSEGWLDRIEQQLKCPVCLEVSDYGYVRLKCGDYICAGCVQGLARHSLAQPTQVMDLALPKVMTQTFPCPRCRAECDIEPNLVVNNQRADSNFLLWRSLWQTLNPSADYLRCNCALGVHDNDNAWINCPARTTPCPWCKQQVRMHAVTSTEATRIVIDHLWSGCTHKFACNYCDVVDAPSGRWRKLHYGYPDLVKHCQAHRTAYLQLHRTRELVQAIHPNSVAYDESMSQFWLRQFMEVMNVVNYHSQYCLYSDDGCIDSPRSQAIRAKLESPFAAQYLADMAEPFYQMLRHPRWSRPGAPMVMEVLPAFMKVMFPEVEPAAPSAGAENLLQRRDSLIDARPVPAPLSDPEFMEVLRVIEEQDRALPELPPRPAAPPIPVRPQRALLSPLLFIERHRPSVNVLDNIYRPLQSDSGDDESEPGNSSAGNSSSEPSRSVEYNNSSDDSDSENEYDPSSEHSDDVDALVQEVGSEMGLDGRRGLPAPVAPSVLNTDRAIERAVRSAHIVMEMMLGQHAEPMQRVGAEQRELVAAMLASEVAEDISLLRQLEEGRGGLLNRDQSQPTVSLLSEDPEFQRLLHDALNEQQE